MGKKSPQKSKLGKRSRTKGAAFEREIVNWFKDLMGEVEGIELDIHRGSQSDEARDSDVAGVPGLWIECRTGKGINVAAKLEQAEWDLRERSAYAQSDRVPVVIFRRFGSRAINVAMTMSTLFEINSQSQELQPSYSGDAIVVMDLSEIKELLKFYIINNYESAK